jgi:hypothetical protein
MIDSISIILKTAIIPISFSIQLLRHKVALVVSGSSLFLIGVMVFPATENACSAATLVA